jgi:hypothetical protein
MEAMIEWLPRIILPTPFDVQKRIQELRGYLDPNDPTYQPEAYAIYTPHRPPRPACQARLFGRRVGTTVFDTCQGCRDCLAPHLSSLAYSLREVSGG